MSYELTIKHIVDNPAYDKEAAEASERRRHENNMRGWGHNEQYYDVPATVDRHALRVVLTDEEFLAVKRAVLEAM